MVALMSLDQVAIKSLKESGKPQTYEKVRQW